MFIEILLKSCKWLICCLFNPNRINVATHLGEIDKALDAYSRKYENTLLIGDFKLQETFMDLLNKFAPLKCKYLRANHSKFMTKELSKAIMLRTRFRHQFLKMKTPEAKAKYNKQRNICVS